MAQNNHAISANYFFHKVRDMDNGATFTAKRINQFHDAAPANYVQRSGRLIKNKKLGIHGERSGNGYALLLASRERCGVCMSAVEKGHSFEFPCYAPTNFIARNLQVFGAKSNVFINDARNYLVFWILKHQPELSPSLFIRLKVGCSGNKDLLANECY